MNIEREKERERGRERPQRETTERDHRDGEGAPPSFAYVTVCM
jgi:hypothetical protein